MSFALIGDRLTMRGMLHSAADVVEAVDVRDVGAQPVLRRVPGRPFERGKSGNPGGKARYKLPNGKTVPQLARERTPAAIMLLGDVVEDTSIELQTRIAAAHALLRCGHADAPRDGGEVGCVTVVVEKFNTVPQPTPGVLASPIPEHICAPNRRAAAVDAEAPAQATQEAA